MSTTARLARPGPVLLLLLLIVSTVWWVTQAGSDAVGSPASAARAAATDGTTQAGRITFDTLPGAAGAVTLPMRSFTAGGATPGASTGGAGAGKFTAEDPAVQLDASDVDPLLLRAVATGAHLPKATATLFRPGTTKRQAVWEFSDVRLSQFLTSQTGSSKPPRVQLALTFAKVKLTSFDADGSKGASFCFDLAAVTGC